MSDADPTPSWQRHEPRERPGGDGSADPRTSAYAGPRPAPYGESPYAAWLPAAPPPRRPLIERADVWTAILGTIAVLIVGVAATFVWLWVAPRVLVTKDAQGAVTVVSSYPKGFAGADVTFLFVTAGAGALCAAVAAIVARHRGLAVTVAMAGGGILSSLMVAWLGRWISGGPLHYWASHASVGTHHLFIQLQTRPFIVAWPIVALGITFIVALATQDRPAEPPKDTVE